MNKVKLKTESVKKKKRNKEIKIKGKLDISLKILCKVDSVLNFKNMH